MLDNQAYYFTIGRGRWRGTFAFRMTDRRALRAAGLRLRDRLLVFGMATTHRLFGASRIDSQVWASPEDGVAGVAGNTVRISKLWLTLYLLRETYTLAANVATWTSMGTSASGRSRSCLRTRSATRR